MMCHHGLEDGGNLVDNGSLSDVSREHTVDVHDVTLGQYNAIVMKMKMGMYKSLGGKVGIRVYYHNYWVGKWPWSTIITLRGEGETCDNKKNAN